MTTADPGELHETARPASRWSRLDTPVVAAALFAATLPIAFVLILYFGRKQWFFLDEWSFIASRPLGAKGVLDDHNGHWVSTPFLMFRGFYSFFGLRSYLPYQLLATLTHLGAVVLSRLVMRRIGVAPWTATLVACCLLLLGSGVGNLVFAFQVSLNGSVVCGLAALLLADHDGPIDRRDTAALTVTLIGLTTSAVMIPMVAAVGLATFVRRGRMVAALHTLPPAGVFSLWYLVYGRDGTAAGEFSFGNFVRFVVDMNRAVFLGLGDFAVAAAILAVTAAIGVAAAWQLGRDSGDRGPFAVASALVVAWWGFAIVTAAGRSDLLEVSSRAPYADRYIHVGAMILMPLVALGIQRVLQARRLAVLVPAAALVVGIPSNVDGLANRNPFLLGTRDLVEAMAGSQYIDQVPANHRLSRQTAFDEFGPMTAGWLRRASAQGDIDPPSHGDPVLQLDADLFVVLDQVVARDEPCTKERAPLKSTVTAGDRVLFDGAVAISIVDEGVSSRPWRVDPAAGSVVDILAGPIEIVVTAPDGGPPLACLAPR